MIIKQKPIVKNDCYVNNQKKADSRYTAFQTRGPKGLMLHSVGTPQPNAEVFANGWNRSNYEVAVHAVLQSDGTVYQCMPWNYRGWHAGGSANDTHIGVEMAEPSDIKYTSGDKFIVTGSLEHAKAVVEGCYKTARDLFASLCIEYGLDPMKDIISHAEGAAKGIASGHSDPEHLWRGLGMGYTMDGFRKDVAEVIEWSKEAKRVEPEPVATAAPILDDGHEALPKNEKEAFRALLLEVIREDPDAILEAMKGAKLR